MSASATVTPDLESQFNNSRSDCSRGLTKARAQRFTEQFRIDDKHRESKREVVSATMAAIKQLQRCEQELNQFIKDSVTSAIHVYVSKGPDAKRLHRALMSRLDIFRARLNLPDILNAQYMARGAPEIWGSANSMIASACERLAESFEKALYQMVENNVFGLIQWHSNDVCEYYYYRAVATLKSAERYKTRTETKEDWSRNRIEEWEFKSRVTRFHEQQFYERHEHHLYESVVTDWPAKNIKMPSYIRELLNRCPAILHPEVQVVSGEMIREDIKVQQISSRQFEREEELYARCIATGRLMSPAVTIGSTVVAGWSDRDL